VVLTTLPSKTFLVTKTDKRRPRFLKNCRGKDEEEQQETLKMEANK
jgi:hypothetical protein